MTADDHRDAAERELLARIGAAMTVAGDSIDDVGRRIEAIAAARGVSDVSVAILPTALFVQTGRDASTQIQLAAFPNQRARLDQITALYDLLHDAERPDVDAREVIDEIDRILVAPPPFGALVRTIGLGVLSVGFALTLQPTPWGVAAAFVLGAFVGLLLLVRAPSFQAALPVAATFAVSTIVFAAAEHYQSAANPVRTLIPPLVVFLPGAALTAGMRDLSAGQIISGSSRLVFGVVTLLLLAFGIVAAATLVGLPASDLVDRPMSRLGPWAPWLGIVFVAAGTHLHHCAPRRAMPWILVVLVVAYSGQALGALVFSAELSSFFGALAMTPVVLWIERLRSGPSSLVTFLPAFWLLVPGAAGLIGVTEIVGTSSTLGIDDFSEAIGAVIAISLGILIGNAAFRAGEAGVHGAARVLPAVDPSDWTRRLSFPRSSAAPDRTGTEDEPL